MSRHEPQRIALIGAGGHASDVLGLIEARNRAGASIDVVGLFHSDPDQVDRGRFVDRSTVHGLDELGGVDPEGLGYIVCVGYPEDRRRIAEQEILGGLRPATVVHDDAELGTGVEIGDGCVVLARVSMSPLVIIEDHAYISHGVLIGHDTLVGEYASVMPGATISGDCVIGAGAMVGSNATVLEKVKVGDGAVIGAGSVVTRNVDPGDVVVGAPARSRRLSDPARADK